ncbi:MAG: cupin domain-containing protein [Cytophagales bacterium]|uniref:cupin domain-containing protein n=1 Tax=Cyclobacterium marinum TaxID=104 RepID=UPI0030D7CF69|nr:cupin domain-containing protein [Cytophagales bacterium]|tara:strand:- start:66892 stop:67440 length:549 start_codon:yes stop_codon:yes gene_type:complete
MDKKNFIKTAGLGIGVALIPEAAISEGLLNKETSTANLKSKIIRDGEGNVVNVLGDIQTHILVGSDTDNQIVEWVDDVEPGVGIPPHIHTKEDEIFRVIEGQIEIMVDGKTTVLKAGDTAFAPKNIPHTWTVVGTEKAKMITSAFPAGIEMMFKELADLPPGPPDFEKVAKICGNHGISFLK